MLTILIKSLSFFIVGSLKFGEYGDVIFTIGDKHEPILADVVKLESGKDVDETLVVLVEDNIEFDVIFWVVELAGLVKGVVVERLLSVKFKTFIRIIFQKLLKI